MKINFANTGYLVLCFILLSTFACKKQCDKDDLVTCHSPTIKAESEVGNSRERYCPNDPDIDIPCDCYNEPEFLTPFDYSTVHADVEPSCVYFSIPVPPGTCTFPGGCPVAPTSTYSIASPYEVPVSYLGSGNEIRAQQMDPTLTGNPLFYFDNTFGSDDLVSRPVYFEFHLNSLDEDADVLRFIVRHVASGTTIADQTINNDPASYVNVLRYYDSGLQEGTVRLDISAAGSMSPVAGNYTIVLIRNGNQEAISTFVLATEFGTVPIFTERCMSMTILHAGTFDWSNYFVDGLFWTTSWDAVFGAGRSNIRSVSTVPVLLGGDNFIDAENDMILRESVLMFSGSSTLSEIDNAINDWWSRLSLAQNWGSGYQNRIAGIEVGFIDMYDLTSGSPVEVIGTNGSSDFRSDAELTVLSFGQVGATYPWFDVLDPDGVPGGPNLFPNYFSGCLVYRTFIQAEFDINQSLFAAGVTADGMSITIMHHEMAHAWVLDANAGPLGLGGDLYHTSYHTGRNTINICLWDYVAQKLTMEQVLFFNQSVSNPRFCEYHQQVFMNQITAL